MPALIGDGVDSPNVPAVPCGRHERVVVVAAAPCLVQPLYLALSGDFCGVFAVRAAPHAVPRRRFRGNGFGYGRSVIVVFLFFRKQEDMFIAAGRAVFAALSKIVKPYRLRFFLLLLKQYL